uniref:Peptidase S9 prolyl oligopeptidase catalytic domain-containing protein n=1 Tax=Kalanchoe fedtschenkoi TaxID=63787 RepID=A0A7N0T9U0_KALFE
MPLSHVPLLRHVSLPSHSHHASSKSRYKYLTADLARTPHPKMEDAVAENLRQHFLQVLRSRRTEVPLSVKPGKPVINPLFQENPPPTSSPAMESCPKKEREHFKDRLKQENLYITTEDGKQGELPVLIMYLEEEECKRRPAIVFLHSTHKCKEWLRPLLEAYASRGYISVAVDSRYHGERATTLTTYREALVSAWKEGDTMPFIFDTAWDLIKLADYLTQREDIDPSKIGITGESLGGMHAWFAAFADTRYSVVAPIIGVQGFKWAIDNDKWHGRVDSIKAVFEEAKKDLHKNAIDKEVVAKVWDRIAPGLAGQFDAPFTIPAIAPRPLLILNGAEDPRCPLTGLDIPEKEASAAYKKANAAAGNFELIAQPGIGHQMTPQMVKEASDWFDKLLL